MRPNCSLYSREDCEKDTHCETINVPFLNRNNNWVINNLPNICKQKKYNTKCLDSNGNPINEYISI